MVTFAEQQNVPPPSTLPRYVATPPRASPSSWAALQVEGAVAEVAVVQAAAELAAAAGRYRTCIHRSAAGANLRRTILC